MSKVVKISDIAKFLETDFYGNNYNINKVASLNNIENNTLVFSKNNVTNKLDFKSLVLTPIDFNYVSNSIYSVIKVENPRLAFAKVVNRFFIKKSKNEIHKTSIVGIKCNIDSSISIGTNCTIGDNVVIGENTIINNNVVVYDNTIIGKNCYIKSGSIIGEDGFGFDFEDDGEPVRIPHLGSVIIGDNVEIGAKNTIARGTLNNTIIQENVKTDDQVHIAHNCNIGKNTIITACSEISGSVEIGKNCWIGPNCSIIQKVNIGDNVTIGIGSVITKDIKENKKIMGLESLELRSLIKVKKKIEYGK